MHEHTAEQTEACLEDCRSWDLERYMQFSIIKIFYSQNCPKINIKTYPNLTKLLLLFKHVKATHKNGDN